jgi:hypothetical protein
MKINHLFRLAVLKTIAVGKEPNGITVSGP